MGGVKGKTKGENPGKWSPVGQIKTIFVEKF
jgi:hypothetical protein